MNKPQSITIDPQALNEDFVQEVIGWMSPKSTEQLKNMLAEAQNQQESFSPETIEAIQRVLAERGELEYSPSQGKKFPLIFEQQIQVQLPDSSTPVFNSRAEVRAAIFEGKITKDTLVRPIHEWGEGLLKQEAFHEREWETLQEYAQTHFTLAPLYTPIKHFMKWGFLAGALLGSQGFVQRSLAPQDSLNILPASIEEGLSFLLFAVLMVFVDYGFWGRLRKKDMMYIGGLYLLLVIMDQPFASSQIMDLVIIHCWILGFLINGIIFGGPLGAIIGTGVGIYRTHYYPKAPDADPEGTQPYWVGLLYPAIFILIAWPLTYIWLFPWFLSILPFPAD